MAETTDEFQQLKAKVEHLRNIVGMLDHKNRKMSEFFVAVRDEYKRKYRQSDRARLAKQRADARYLQAYDQAEPLVTVIIPTYNRPQMVIERSMPSVFAQSYQNWELIIVGDGMAEEQADILSSLIRPRVRFVNLVRRGKYPAAKGPMNYVGGIKPMNFGLRIAQGHWITHLDDDDEYTPNHIGDLLNEARAKRVEWVHGKIEFADESGARRATIGHPEPALGRISRISSLYHASLKTFRYNPVCWRYYYPGDWDLWERFLDMGVTHAHLDRIVGVHHGPVSAGIVNADVASTSPASPR